MKLVLFATESRFGHRASDTFLPGWRLVCHCHVSDPGLLAGHIFSRDVIRFISGSRKSPCSPWDPPEAEWPVKADFESGESSYRYLRVETSRESEPVSEEKWVLFVNFCDEAARSPLEKNLEKIERMADACLADCVDLLPKEAGQGSECDTYGAITRMMAPVTRSENPREDLRQVLAFYLENILTEIKRRREDMTFGEDDRVSPRCPTLWPIFEPVIGPPLEEMLFEIRKNGYTRWLSEESVEQSADGLWITREKDATVPNKVQKFQMTGRELGIQGEFRGPTLGVEPDLVGREWEINPGDQDYSTLVGLAVGLEATPQEGDETEESSSGALREIGAVVWVENRRTIPYSAIRAAHLDGARLAQGARNRVFAHRARNSEVSAPRPRKTRARPGPSPRNGLKSPGTSV